MAFKYRVIRIFFLPKRSTALLLEIERSRTAKRRMIRVYSPPRKLSFSTTIINSFLNAIARNVNGIIIIERYLTAK